MPHRRVPVRVSQFTAQSGEYDPYRLRQERELLEKYRMETERHRKEEPQCSAALQEAVESARLVSSKLLRHKEQELAVLVVDLSQEPTEARQYARILAGTSPHDVAR